MLRTLRSADISQLPDLLRRNFPEEEVLLETDPEGFVRVARRILRWDARFVLGLMRAFGHPVFRFLVVEADGRIAATALLTYPNPKSTYVSMVMVDGPYRRRGLARQMMREAAGRTASSRRKYTVLDVLEGNASARRLYESEGYRTLREESYLQRPLGPEAPLPPAPPPRGLRTTRRSDEPTLAQIANGLNEPLVREVLPYEPRDFGPAPRVVAMLESKAESYVVDDGGGPVAFLRATMNAIMRSGHLTVPVLGPALDDARADQLVRQGLSFLEREGAKRALVNAPRSATRALQALAHAGFTEAFRTLTLYRPVEG